MKEVVSDSFKGISKKFWQYVKSIKQESSGVIPLKDENWFLKIDSHSKANIVNTQFQSVFTKEDTSSLPDKGPNPYQDIHSIKVKWKGVHKCLKGLKPFKATGPDSIPSFILKAAADQLATILTILYKMSLDMYRYQQIGEMHGLYLCLRRVRSTNWPTADLCLLHPSPASYLNI